MSSSEPSNKRFSETRLHDYKKGVRFSHRYDENGSRSKIDWRISWPNSAKFLLSNFSYLSSEFEGKFFYLDEKDVRMEGFEKHVTSLDAFSRAFPEKRVYLREIRPSSVRNAAVRRFFTDEVLEILHVVLRQQKTLIEESAGGLMKYRILWDSEDGNVLHTIDFCRFHQVLDEFDIDKSLITLLPDPAVESDRMLFVEKGKSVISTVCPDGCEIFDACQALLLIFFKTVADWSWDVEPCGEKECNGRQKEKVLKAMRKILEAGETSFVSADSLQAILEELHDPCPGRNSRHTVILETLANLDNAHPYSLVESLPNWRNIAMLYNLGPYYRSFRESGGSLGNENGVPVYVIRLFLNVEWATQFFDKENADLKRLIFEALPFKVPLEVTQQVWNFLRTLLEKDASTFAIQDRYNLRAGESRNEKLRQRREQKKGKKQQPRNEKKGDPHIHRSTMPVLQKKERLPRSLVKEAQKERMSPYFQLKRDMGGITLETMSPGGARQEGKARAIMSSSEGSGVDSNLDGAPGSSTKSDDVGTSKDQSFKRTLNLDLPEWMARICLSTNGMLETGHAPLEGFWEEVSGDQNLDDSLANGAESGKIEEPVDDAETEKTSETMESEIKAAEEEVSEAPIYEGPTTTARIADVLSLMTLDGESSEDSENPKEGALDVSTATRTSAEGEKKPVEPPARIEARDPSTRPKFCKSCLELMKLNHKAMKHLDMEQNMFKTYKDLDKRTNELKTKMENLEKETKKLQEKVRRADDVEKQLEAEREAMKLLEKKAKRVDEVEKRMREKETELSKMKKEVEKSKGENEKLKKELMQMKSESERLKVAEKNLKAKDVENEKSKKGLLARISKLTLAREEDVLKISNLEEQIQQMQKCQGRQIKQQQTPSASESSTSESFQSQISTIQALLNRLASSEAAQGRENQKLKETKKQRIQSQGEMLDSECLICFEEMKSKDKKLKCEHCKKTTHLKCASDWHKIHRSCPHCRREQLDPNEFPALR